MGGFSIFHWLIVLLVCIFLIWPWMCIVKKAGYSPWWAVLGVVPLVGLVMLWVFAYAKWPVLHGTDSGKQ